MPRPLQRTLQKLKSWLLRHTGQSPAVARMRGPRASVLAPSGRDIPPKPARNATTDETAIADPLTRGLALLHERPEAAAAIFENMLTAKPEDIPTHRYLSEAYARLARLEEAAAAMDKWFSGFLLEDGSAGIRAQAAAARERQIPGMLFVAMQKSASEYLRDLFVQAFDVPIVYPNVGSIPKDRLAPSVLTFLKSGGAFARLHSDGAPENIRSLQEAGFGQVVVHCRDPRQVTLSWLEMMRRISEQEFSYSLTMYHPHVPGDFRSWQPERQADWAIDNYLPGQVSWLSQWREAAKDPSAMIVFTRFEDLLENETALIETLAGSFGVDPAPVVARAAEIQKERQRNYRSGQTEEWRQAFLPAQTSRIAEIVPAGLMESFAWPVD